MTSSCLPWAAVSAVSCVTPRFYPWSAQPYHVPGAAELDDVVAADVARAEVAREGVERVAVVGRLQGAVGAVEGAELARQRVAGDHLGLAGHRRPLRQAHVVAGGVTRGVLAEPVRGVAGAVGEHGARGAGLVRLQQDDAVAADVAGQQARPARRGRRAGR